jgi:hypothetical protein
MHNLSLNCQDKRAQSNSREVLAKKTGTSNLMTKAMQKVFVMAYLKQEPVG